MGNLLVVLHEQVTLEDKWSRKNLASRMSALYEEKI